MGEQAVQKPAAQGKFGWLWKILKWTGIIFGSLILLIILLIATLYFHEKKAQKSEYSGKHTALEKIELKRGSRLDLGSVNLNGYQSNFEKPLKIKSAGVSTPQKFKNASLIEASPQKFLYEDTIAFIFDKDIFTVGDVSPEKQHIFIDGLSGYERAQNGSMLKLFVTGNIKYGVKYDGSFQYEGRTLTFSFIKPLLCSAYYNSDRQYYNLYLDDTQNFDELKPLLEQYLFIVAEKDNKKVTAKVIVEKDRYDNIIVRSSLDFPALLKQSLESTDDLVIQNRDHERLKVGNNFSATKFTLQEVRANKRVRDFVVFRFSKRVRPKDFYEKLKISPAPLGVAWETTAANSAQSDDTESEDGEYSEYDEGSAETYGTNEIYLSTASFKPKQVYAFQVKGELRSVDGDLLKEDISLKIEMKNALPVLNLQDGISIVEAAYPYYPVKIRNLEQVDVRIAKLNGKETIDVLKDKLYSNEKLYREGINSYAKVKQARKKYDRYAHEIKSVSLNGAVDNLIQYSKIDLAKPGHYLISVWPSRQDIEREGAILAEMMPKVAFINVTDIGLIAKKSLNEIAVWTTELESGKPKPNQEVVIYDTAHRVIAKGRTGADGFLALQINHKVDKDKLFVTAGNKEDSAVVGLESEYGNGFDANISTWEFGIESWSLKDFLNNYNSRFFLVTDSPIYKPGSEVNYKLYLREYNEKGLDYYRGKKRVEIEVYDPQWEVITRETVTLGKDSSAVGSFRLKSNTKLGGYFIQISTDKNHGRRVAEFLVADYRTPKSKFRVNSDKRYYYPGESAKFTLTADYYFGQPIQNAPININCRYTRNYNAADDENYESYVFYNEDIMFKSSEKTFAQNSGEAGRLSFLQPLYNGELGMPVNMSFEFTLQDPLGLNEKMTKYVDCTMYPADFKIGIKQKGFSAAAGSPSVFNVITVDHAEKMVSRELEYSIYQDQVYTVREKGAGNAFEYTNISTPLLITTKRISTSTSEIVQLSETLAQAGHYYIIIKGTDNQGNATQTKYGFYVSQGEYNWGRYNHDRIDLSVDKPSAKVGETVQLLIKSPYARASGLLTIENKGIVDHQYFEVNSNSPLITIPIKKEYYPNFFAGITLVQGRVDKPIKVAEDGMVQIDLGRPSFKMGYQGIKVKIDNRDITLNITTERKEYSPGDLVKGKVNLANIDPKDRANITVLVVNNALFDLSTLQTNIGEAMYPNLPLLVENYTNYNRIVGRRLFGKKGAIAGGGGGLESDKSKVRKNFRDIVYFDPYVKVQNGKGEFSFKLPDNAGEFKILIFADNGPAKFGYGDTVVKSTQALLIENAFPNFLRTADVCNSGVVIYNNTKKQLSCLLKTFWTLDNAELGNRENKLTVGDKAEQTYKITVPQFHEVPEKTMRFDIRATTEISADHVEYTVPVYSNLLAKTTAINKIIFTDEKGKFQRESVLNLSEQNAVPELTSASLAIDREIGNITRAPLQYLLYYPHECWEQKLDRLVANAISLSAGGKGLLSKAILKRNISKIMADLPKYQRDNGLFGYWPKSESYSYYLSVYTLQVFNYLNEQNIGYNKKYIERLVKALRETGSRSAQDSYDSTLPYAYFLYELDRSGTNVRALLAEDKLFGQGEFQEILFSYALFTKYKVFPEKCKALRQKLTNYMYTDASLHRQIKLHKYNFIWHDSDVKATALAMGIFAEDKELEPSALEMLKFLIGEKKFDNRWYNTQDNAQVLMNLAKMRNKYFKNGALQCKVSLGNAQVLDQKVSGEKFTKDLDQKLLPSNKPLLTKIEASGKPRSAAFYTLSVTQYCTGLSENLYKSFAVSTQYFDLAGNEVTSFIQGQNYKVRLNIQVFDNCNFVVCTDKVPAALMPIDFDLQSSQQTLADRLKTNMSPSYQQINLDRVSYYFDYLPSGKYYIEYMTQAVARGEFGDPGITIEEMYDPSIQAIERDRRITAR